MPPPRLLAAALLSAALVSLPAVLEALEVRVTRLRITGTRLWTSVQVSDLLRDKFLALIREGRAVFVQLQVDLWEDRRVFDRIVLTTPPITYRLNDEPTSGGILVQDQHGGSTPHPDIRQPLSLRVDLGAASRIEDSANYYVHASLSAATVDERDIEAAGATVFGDEESARGLAALGRFVFRTLLRMGKYFETAETEVTSRRVSGREIRSNAF